MLRTLSAALLLLIAATAVAQDIDRRSRDEPEMFVEAGGRAGTCDILMFSPDGKYLYAAGDDKVVHVWPVGDTGLQTARVQRLHWPAWREQRGGIKTIALSPGATDRRVFVAGYGLKPASAVVLKEDGEFDCTNAIKDTALPGTNIMASAFDGKSVVYGSADGSLWHWTLPGTHRLLGRHERIRDAAGSESPFNRPRLIRFLDDGSVISVAESGEVLKFPLYAAGPLPAVLHVRSSFDAGIQAAGQGAHQRSFQVVRADLSPDQKWLACSYQPNYLVICPMNGGAARILKVEFAVRSLAFDSAGRLAVAFSADNKQTNFRVEADDTIRIYDSPGQNFEASVEIKHRGRTEAMAWGPKGLLAVAGGDNHEITLHDLKPPVNKAAGPMQVVRGKGRGLWEVRIDTDENCILFKPSRDPKATDPNRRGDGAWVAFDFTKGQPAGEKQPAEILTEAGGWKIEPSKDNPMLWNAVPIAGGEPLPLKLDPDRDEQPRCYCFLPPKPGEPTRVLVGHYYGFSMFVLEGNRARRVNLATGHAGDVMSIAAARDGTWCVTCGMDQTVSVWSLKDSPSGLFGAVLQPAADGKLFVEHVDIGGPAWEMGLSKGDEILFLKVGGVKRVFGQPGTYGKGLPDKKKDHLTQREGSAAGSRRRAREPDVGDRTIPRLEVAGHGRGGRGFDHAPPPPGVAVFPRIRREQRIRALDRLDVEDGTLCHLHERRLPGWLAAQRPGHDRR